MDEHAIRNLLTFYVGQIWRARLLAVACCLALLLVVLVGWLAVLPDAILLPLLVGAGLCGHGLTVIVYWGREAQDALDRRR